eukprot:scaffold119489_cov28-Tisochrysis_lutea.AAC.7
MQVHATASISARKPDHRTRAPTVCNAVYSGSVYPLGAIRAKERHPKPRAASIARINVPNTRTACEARRKVYNCDGGLGVA